MINMAMQCWIAVSLYLLFRIYSVYADIALTVTEGDIRILQNNDVTLTCVLTGATDPVMSWKLPDGFNYEPAEYSGRSFGPGGRYSFQTVGDSHSIVIQDVQARDKGLFQCTLVPTQTNNFVHKTKAITLTVLVPPPGLPRIEGLENAVIEPSSLNLAILTVPHDVDRARIKCAVGPSNPLVPIKWFREGQELTTGVETLPSTEDANKTHTSYSVLTITEPGESFNKKQFKCMADLSGLELANRFATFNLSVQSPPSIPVIAGWQNTSYQPNDTVQLQCTVLGGNPLPTIQWYRNGEPFRHEFRTFEQTQKVISEIVINIEAADNNREYRCDAKNAALPVARTHSVKFQVRFPPNFVMIDGGGLVKAGSSITLSCTTDNSNPRAIINWYSRGLLISPDGDSKIEASDNGGFITQSNITFVANRIDHGAEYMCQASNHELHGVVSKSINLDVAFPPDAMAITGFDTANTVTVDTAHKLTCTTNGGNPLPDLSWYKGSTQLTNVGELRAIGKIRSLEYQFIAKPEDNAALYKCKASHANVPEPHKEVNITVSVYFPPQNVTITASQTMKEGEAVTLLCNSGTSNPESAIRWLKNETEIVDSRINSSSKSSAYGGMATTSQYTFTPQASDNGLVIQCFARNSEIRRSATKGLTLNIQHKPIFRGTPAKITVSEGANSTGNNFTVVSNPPPSKYTWFKLDGGVETELKFEAKRDGTTPQLSVDGGILNLVHINRDKAGSYRVKADNDAGQTSIDFTIDVQYGPSIPNSPSQTYTDGDSTLKLSCVIDANPPVTGDQASWKRADYDMGRATQSIDPGQGNLVTAVMTVTNVVSEDIGKFTCEATNSLGTASKDYTVNPVAFLPEINKDAATAKAAAQTQSDGEMKCIMEAFPQPTVEWRKGGQLLELNGEKYSMVTKKEGKIKFTFTLTVKGVTDKDYGAYECKASNSKGEDAHEIVLSGTSKPDAPTGLSVQNYTDNSVILTWTQSFDGGLEQTFKIRYHIPALGKQFMYADAKSPPFTLEGLKPETTYELSIQSYNDLGESPYLPPAISVITNATPTAKPVVVTPAPTDEPMLIVIMALAVVGGLLLIVTTVLVCIFVRRRRKRKMSEATDSASQSNTVEMYGTHDGSFFQDDAKSYSTYEKGLDEDYAKHYDDDDDDIDHIKRGAKNTYLTDDPLPPNGPTPWAKVEDPLGHSGLYIKHVPSVGSVPLDDNYANELRHVTKSLQRPENTQRPSWVANRPPPPAPPGRSSSRPNFDSPPNIPDRNYSPLTDYQAYPTQAGLYHASFGRSTPSVESTDDMRGHLV